MADKIPFGDLLVLDPERGTVDIVWQGRSILQGASAEAHYRDAQGRPRRLALEGANVAYGLGDKRATLSRSENGVELVWHAFEGKETQLWLQVVNRSRDPLRLEALHVLMVEGANPSAGPRTRAGRGVDIGAPPTDWRFYQNGWQSWSAAFARSASDGLYADPATEEYRIKHQPHPVPSAPKVMSSEWFSVLTGPRAGRPRNPALLLGFVTTADQLAEIRLELERGTFRRLCATASADGILLGPGEKLTSERLLVAADADPVGLLERYAASWSDHMRARPLAQPLTGWCTWYYFYGENTESDVIANLERIRAERLPLDAAVVDDGYQLADGDWTRVDAVRFPHGMKWLAAECKRAGMRPGLWVAPFAAGENSHLARQHPEFLLRDASGAPVFSWQHKTERCYSLDLSRRDVQEWLRSTFRTLSDDWGFEFFKLDFVYTGASVGVRADPRMTRAQALRRGLEIIREAVGDKVILGCGAPFGPSIGIVDAMRIGPDIAVNWEPFFRGDLTSPATFHAMRNTVARTFLHRRLWLNDPDCVLVRRRDDESALVLNEMRTMVSLVGLSGGAVISGDNLPSIRRGRLKYLKQILPPSNQAARAVDLFEHELPQLFVLPVEREWGDWTVIAVVNWDDKTTLTEIELGRVGLDPRRDYHVYNYWHRRYVGIVRERLKITRHQPHETRLLLFKPVSDRVELLTTTFHVTQGLCEVKKIDREERKEEKGKTRDRIVHALRVELEKRGTQRGDVIFAIPKGYRVLATRVDGRMSPRRRVGEGIVAVGLTLDEHATVEIEVASNPG